MFNILDFDNARVRTDNKKIQSIKDLDENVILKPDKGEGVVIVSRVDYETSMQELLSDRKRFRIIKEDLTPTRLSSVQRYLRNLQKRGEIDEATYQSIRPQSAKPARAHGLPEIHKPFDDIPKFRPIIDTTGTTHYEIGKYLSQLLHPLTINELTIKDTFDAKTRIETIDQSYFKQGYKYVSFDVESLFTNVPLEKPSKSSKGESMMKKNYQQHWKDLPYESSYVTHVRKQFSVVIISIIDGVSIGGSLGPVLANIILTEFEQIIITTTINGNNYKCRQQLRQQL